MTDRLFLWSLAASLLLHGLLLFAAHGAGLPNARTTVHSDMLAVHLVEPHSHRDQPTSMLQPAMLVAAASHSKVPTAAPSRSETASRDLPAASETNGDGAAQPQPATPTEPTGIALPGTLPLPWLAGARPDQRPQQQAVYFRQMTQMREKQQTEKQTLIAGKNLYLLLSAHYRQADRQPPGQCLLQQGNSQRLACEPATLVAALAEDEATVIEALQALHKADASIRGFSVSVQQGEPAIHLIHDLAGGDHS